MSLSFTNIMSLELANTVRPDQRFAKRDNVEYSVFSTYVEDASTIEQWVGVSRPVPVLIDPQTYEDLRNKRIEWKFDGEKCLIGCEIKSEEL